MDPIGTLIWGTTCVAFWVAAAYVLFVLVQLGSRVRTAVTGKPRRTSLVGKPRRVVHIAGVTSIVIVVAVSAFLFYALSQWDL